MRYSTYIPSILPFIICVEKDVFCVQINKIKIREIGRAFVYKRAKRKGGQIKCTNVTIYCSHLWLWTSQKCRYVPLEAIMAHANTIYVCPSIWCKHQRKEREICKMKRDVVVRTNTPSHECNNHDNEVEWWRIMIVFHEGTEIKRKGDESTW